MTASGTDFPRGWTLQNSATGSAAAIVRNASPGVSQVLDSLHATVSAPGTSWLRNDLENGTGNAASVTYNAGATPTVIDSLSAKFDVIVASAAGAIAELFVNGVLKWSEPMFVNGPGGDSAGFTGGGIVVPAGQTVQATFNTPTFVGQTVQSITLQGHDLASDASLAFKIIVTVNATQIIAPALTIGEPPNVGTLELSGLDIATPPGASLNVGFSGAGGGSTVQDLVIQGHDL